MSGTDAPAISAVRLLLRYLEQEGVEYIFGIPGGPIISLYEALYDRGVIKPVLTKHEAGAAFMADGYARVSGKIGVCCTTTGPGATNALTGIAVAHADHIPVLVLTAQVPTHHFGKGAFQESSPEECDIVSLFRPVTKWSAMIPHPSLAGEAIRKALRLMTSGRPGPVHLSLPCDFAARLVADELVPASRFRFAARTFDREAVKAGAGLLLSARRPAILAGQGVNLGKAWGPLRALADRFRIPVATTFKAKGAFPEDHPLSLGVFCPAAPEAVREFVAGAGCDALLAVGTGLGEASSCGWDERLARKTLLQIDVEPAVIGRNFPVAAGLVGDAAAVLTELRFQMERDVQRSGFDSSRTRPSGVEAVPKEPPGPEETAASGPLSPRGLLRELRRALPRDAAVFVDNGTMRIWTGSHFPVYRHDSFFVNMGLASMGYAVAGSIGGALAARERPVVALSGDAAFAMNGMEVHTAVEHDVPVIWVVANNGGHGMIYHGERMLYKGKFVSSIFRSRLDIGGIAAAMGAAAFRVERPGELGPAVEEALRLRRPCVIDVAVALDEAPPMGARVRAIQKELAVGAPT